MLGLIICAISFIISFYTCNLIIEQTGDEPEYADTLKKYYGEIGYYSALIAPAFLIVGAVTVYFVIMS